MKLSSRNIHLGVRDADPVFGSVIPPIYTSATFIFPNAKEGARRFAGKSAGMIYSRFTNPTVAALEKRLAALEGGQMALATASGMAAINLTLLHFLRSGDSLVAHQVLYGGTFQLVSKILPRFGIKTRIIDFNNPNNIEKSIDKTTKMIYFESPTNPLLEILDIKKITAIAKKHQILTVFDNTFSPPPLQYPLKLGVDVVIHSLTKYINGHSDIIGGAVIGPGKLLKDLYWESFIPMGPTLSPFAAYLVIRGMETLEVRIKRQCVSAYTVAKYLEKHPKIKRVYYPKLKSHPQYDLAQKQMADFGGVLSFEVKGGYNMGEKLVNSVKLINLAVSLGAVESLIEHPASMTHSELSPSECKKSGINEALVRLSVGLEDVEDLISDLNFALEKC